MTEVNFEVAEDGRCILCGFYTPIKHIRVWKYGQYDYKICQFCFYRMAQVLFKNDEVKNFQL